jgi:hypothetical protein
VLRFCRCLAFVLAFEQAALAQSVVRLQGLDRLYFEHVGGTQDHSAVPTFLAAFLPPEMLAANISPRKAVHQLMDGELELRVEVRDFRLPLEHTSSDLFVRQINAGWETQRITQSWWALYDHGRRSDVWYFTADPERTETKALWNYEIQAASASADGVELRVYGSMFRPQGAWWVSGKTLSFSVNDGTLRFSRVRNDFGFFRDYDLGQAPPALDVRTEREVGGHFEVLSYDKIGDKTLRACRFQDSSLDEHWEFDWTRMERTTQCIAEKVKPEASYRGLDQPAFIERGGK